MKSRAREFRYPTSGDWYKGNTHLHSTASDGGADFAALATLYADAGYDFLCRTDHWVASRLADDSAQYPLLWLDGVELDGRNDAGTWYHAVCLGSLAPVDRATGFPAALAAAHQQNALVIAAHPFWCGNDLSDVVGRGFHGVEIYNHVCGWLNGKSDSLVYWHAMLAENPDALAFAVDDVHLGANNPVWQGGWITVRAPELTAESLLSAIRCGHFYASCGPEIHNLNCHHGRLTIHSSPVRFARLVGPHCLGQRQGTPAGPLRTESIFDVPEDWPYVYLELEDAAGRRAWTNTLFTGSQSQHGGA